MDYQEARTVAITNSYLREINNLRYQPGQPTIVLLPGGMGSQLDQSTRPFRGTVPENFDPIWIDLGILPFLGADARKLEITGDLADIGGHIVVPNGPLRFTGLRSYDDTERFFSSHGYNYVVFGFDWRRQLQEAVGFLRQFLSALAVLWLDQDPNADVTLLCHSQGGLVGKLFLDTYATAPSSFPRYLKRVVCVAAPFYGTGTHMQRYFVGDKALNVLYPAKTVAEVTSTLPGPYALLPIDLQTFGKVGASIGLSSYPVSDATTGAPADPYGDDSQALDRYPQFVNHGLRLAAGRVRQAVASPLPPALHDRMWFIRSGLTETPVRFRWSTVPPDYDPGRPSSQPPYEAIDDGPGDGTVPFWSAVLAGTSPGHIHDCQVAKDHPRLAEHPEVLNVVHTIVRENQLAGAERMRSLLNAQPTPAGVASSHEVQDLLSQTRQHRDEEEARRTFQRAGESFIRGLLDEVRR